MDKTGESTVIKDLERVVTGAEKLPLRVEYCMAWQDSKKINEADMQQQTELIQLAQNPAAVTTEKVEEITKRTTPHDVKVRIDMYANIMSLSIYEKIKPAPSIAGGLVYQSPGEYKSDSWREGVLYVFLGKNWKMNTSGGTWVDYTPNKSLPHTTVQNITVKIYADPARARGIADKIDWEALKKLIKN